VAIKYKIGDIVRVDGRIGRVNSKRVHLKVPIYYIKFDNGDPIAYYGKRLELVNSAS